MSGEFAHVNYKSHGWDIQQLFYSRIYPKDGNPSSKNLAFAFSNELSRKESEFMTGSIKICLTLIGYYYYFYY